MAKGKAVSKKVASGVPAAIDYGEDQGKGFENQTREDYAIPLINVLQALSPKVTEKGSDIEAGGIINSATGRVFEGDKGLRFVPCITQHVFVEWTPRDQGGGFVAVHELGSDVVVSAKEKADSFGKYKTHNGNDLIETFYVYGIALDDDDNPFQAVIPFTSTKIKRYRTWMTTAKDIRIKVGDKRIAPPLFAHVYKLKTTQEKNNQGEFYNLTVGFAGKSADDCRLAPDNDLYLLARDCRDNVAAGSARADFAADERASGETGGAGKTAETAAGDDIPF